MTTGSTKQSWLLSIDENLVFYPIGIRHECDDLAINQDNAKSIIKSIEDGGKWHAPKIVDLARFALEIWSLQWNYTVWIKQYSDAEAKRRYDRLKKLRHHLQKAHRLYAADAPWLNKNLTAGWGEKLNFIKVLEDSQIKTRAHGLDELQDAISMLAAQIDRVIYYDSLLERDKVSAYPLRHMTPTRILALELERICNQYLFLEAKFSRKSAEPNPGQLSGPFIRFASATMVAINADLKPETIAKAVQYNRTLRSRMGADISD
jgi:hypothetical protein